MSSVADFFRRFAQNRIKIAQSVIKPLLFISSLNSSSASFKALIPSKATINSLSVGLLVTNI